MKRLLALLALALAACAARADILSVMLLPDGTLEVTQSDINPRAVCLAIDDPSYRCSPRFIVTRQIYAARDGNIVVVKRYVKETRETWVELKGE